MTTVLIIANVVLFALQHINAVYIGYRVDRWLALSHTGLAQGYLWQLITFQVLHAGPWHLVCNLMAIYFFGRPVEERYGRAGLLKLYFGTGLAGGLLQSLLGAIWPMTFGGPVVGASAGAAGLVAAFALLDPNATIMAFMVLPIRAKYFLWFSLAVALFFVAVPPRDGIAHAAHLGGLLAGVAYVRWGAQALLWTRRPQRLRVRPRELVKVRSPKSWLEQKSQRSDELPPEEFISREVDPILDKISAQGIHSLTPKERQILEAARSKMRRR